MNRESKHKGIDFLDIALDSCAYLYLLLFWLLILLFPLLFFIIYISKGFDISPLIIICLALFLLSLIPYYISKGIILRKKFRMSIGILISLYLIYSNIKPLEGIKKTEIINHLSNISTIIVFSIIIMILFIGLFFRKKI